jgi:MFS family permease
VLTWGAKSKGESDILYSRGDFPLLTDRQRALVVLALSFLIVFASLGLGRFGFGMVWPAMQKALDLSNTNGGQLQSWNSAGYLLFVVVAGVLATRYGPRVVIVGALGLIGVALILTGMTRDFALISLGRFLAGVGAGAANVPAMAMLAGWFSGRRRGIAAGIAVAGSSLGLAVTGASVPWILARQGMGGWQTCWYFFGAVTLLICFFCALFLRNREEIVPRKSSEKMEEKIHDTWGDIRTVLRTPLLWKISTGYFAFGFSYSIYATFFVKHLVSGVGFPRAGPARSG